MHQSLSANRSVTSSEQQEWPSRKPDMLGEKPLKIRGTVHEIIFSQIISVYQIEAILDNSCSYGRGGGGGVNGGFMVTLNLICCKSTFDGDFDLSRGGGFKFYDSV